MGFRIPPDERRCTAKAKTTGNRCTRPKCPGKDKCFYHGGATPSGVNASKFKNGLRSKVFPKRLMERYQEALDDPDLRKIDSDLAAIEARLSDLFSRVDSGENGKTWQQARKANDDLRKALNNENYGAVVQASTELDRLIGSGITDYDAWEQIRVLIEQRRKLLDSETKHLIVNNQMITAQQGLVLITALAAIVKSHITDPDTLYKIQNDLGRLMNRPEPVTIEAQR